MAIGMGNRKYANQYDVSTNSARAWFMLNSDIILFTTGDSRLLLMAQRKNRLNTIANATVLLVDF